MAAARVLLVLALIAVGIGHVSAISCYSCSYVTGVTDTAVCQAPTSATSVSTGCTSCMKTYAKASGYETITRSCVSVCAEVSTSVGSTYCCSGDKCNSAKGISASLLTLGAAMLAFRLLRRE